MGSVDHSQSAIIPHGSGRPSLQTPGGCEAPSPDFKACLRFDVGPGHSLLSTERSTPDPGAESRSRFVSDLEPCPRSLARERKPFRPQQRLRWAVMTRERLRHSRPISQTCAMADQPQQPTHSEAGSMNAGSLLRGWVLFRIVRQDTSSES